MILRAFRQSDNVIGERVEVVFVGAHVDCVLMSAAIFVISNSGIHQLDCKMSVRKVSAELEVAHASSSRLVQELRAAQDRVQELQVQLQSEDVNYIHAQPRLMKS